MHIVIGGASGFLGTHLARELESRGHRVTGLTRRQATGPGQSTWDPAGGRVDPGGRGGRRRREPRRHTDRGEPPLPHVGRQPALEPGAEHRDPGRGHRREREEAAFLAGNGISVYGDHGSEPLTETADSRGDDLLTQVTRVWEAAAQPARDAGARVCILRTAPVMDVRSQPLKALRLLFTFGLGGRLSDGNQYFPMISLRDWVGGVAHLVEHQDASGPFNLSCPETPTNAQFTQALGRALGRPTVLPAPAFAIRLGASQMAPELLGSKNSVPQALIDAGYEFRDRDVTAVLAAGLAQSS